MKNIKYIVLLTVSLSMTMFFTSCENENYPYFIKVVPVTDCATRYPDIPPDSGAAAAPAITLNNVTPTGVFSKDECVVKVNLIGIIDPATNKAVELIYNQNVFLTEDGIPQGMKVVNQTNVTTAAFDVVFIVDNSGSMYEEADTIAGKIASFVSFLQSKGIDLRTGCAGYNESSSISGALNLTNGQALVNYLLDPNYSGTSRTRHFAGSDSANLVSKAMTHPTESGENGCVAIDFADKYFNWRSNATRVYINFTDEPIQSTGKTDVYSIPGFLANWNAAKGSIHSVFSITSWDGTGTIADTAYIASWWNEYAERPWMLAIGTGGTSKFIHPDAHDLDLTTLPVTTAIINSSTLYYVSSDASKAHNVVITIKHGSVEGRKEYLNQGY